jgi:hypothetical protein
MGILRGLFPLVVKFFLDSARYLATGKLLKRNLKEEIIRFMTMAGIQLTVPIPHA